MKNYTGSKTALSYSEEWNEFIDLDVDYGGGAVIANRTITTMAGMTANKYDGQVAFVQYRGGAVDGEAFHIVTNTATVITFEENVQTAGLADTDDLSITLTGVLPTTTTEWFANVVEVDLPDPSTTPVQHHAHGSTNQPEANDVSLTKKEYVTTIPLKLINGKLLLYGLGYVKDVASNFGALATNSSRAVMIGETRIVTDLATPSGFLATDYVQIGDTTEGEEIRQVSSVTANTPVGFDTLNLDKPVRRFHPDNCVVKECDITTAKPVTHTIKPWHDAPTITLEGVFKGFDKNHTVNDFVKHYMGMGFKSLALKSNEETLDMDIAVSCLDAKKNQRTRANIVTADWTARKFLHADSTVTINSVVYAQVENLTYGTDRNLKPKYYHSKNTGIKPFEHIQEGFEHNWKLGIPLHNTTFWDLIEDGTKFTATVRYDRDTSDDYVIFTFTDTYYIGGPTKLTDRTESIQELDSNMENFQAAFTDTIEYY